MSILNMLPSDTTREPTFGGNIGALSGGSTTRLVNGHILRGFSGGNARYFPRTTGDEIPVYDMTRPFHIHIKAAFSQLTTRSQILIGSASGAALQYSRPLLEFAKATGDDNLVTASFSTDGSSWDVTLSVTKAEMPFAADRWYTVDYAWEPTENPGVFTLSVSNGVTTVTKTALAQHFNTSGDDNGTRVEIGALVGTAPALHASVDLLDTYWEQNGTLIWGNKT